MSSDERVREAGFIGVHCRVRAAYWETLTGERSAGIANALASVSLGSERALGVQVGVFQYNCDPFGTTV
jgi:hypothetical protein